MPLHVICPGCLKRFQVSVRFAGMEGPCPNCNTVISIPKESVKIHGEEAGAKLSKQENKRRSLLRPFPRLDAEWNPLQARRYSLGIIGILVLTFLLGCIPMPAVLRGLIGIIGLCLAAFPLALFGYWVTLDREQIFVLTGKELYRRAGIVAAGYVILWLIFEYFLATTQANYLVSSLYFVTFAVLATLLVHPILELKLPDAFLHYCIYGLSITLLRFCIGFGWFWRSSEWIRHSTAPPVPLLPGM